MVSSTVEVDFGGRVGVVLLGADPEVCVLCFFLRVNLVRCSASTLHHCYGKNVPYYYTRRPRWYIPFQHLSAYMHSTLVSIAARMYSIASSRQLVLSSTQI